MAKGYIIAHIVVTDPEPYKEYVARDTPILHALGGRFIVRGGTCDVVEGQLDGRHVVIEFDSYEQALRAYHDPEYHAVADIRKANATSSIVVVEGTD